MAKWPMVKLGDAASISRSSLRPDAMTGDEAYLGLENIEPGGRILGWTTTGAASVSSSKFRFDTAHVLMGKLRPYLGKISSPDRAGVCSTDIIPILTGPELDKDFLLFWLRTEHMINQANRASTGANLPRISPKSILALEVPLPPLEEQQRIAAILNEVESLKSKTQDSIKAVDAIPGQLIQEVWSRFTAEMTPLGLCIASIDGGKSPRCESRPAADDDWGVLKLSAVTSGHFLASENKALKEVTPDVKQREVHAGDLLMTRKNTPELVGAVCLVEDVRPQLAFPDLVFRINLDQEKLLPRYFQALMMTPEYRSKVRDLAGGSAKSMSNISQTKLRNLEIPIPPISVQSEFSEAARKVSDLRSHLQGKLRKLQQLQHSLATRAFAGEL